MRLGGLTAVEWPFERRLAAMFAVAGLTISGPSLAHSGPIEVELAAEIPPRCGFAEGNVRAPSGTADLEKQGRLTLRLRLDCNTPYAIGVVAEAGALTNLDALPDGSGYAFSKQYALTLQLDTDQGKRTSSECTSPDLVAGGACPFASSAPGSGFSSGEGISVNRDATLLIEWPDQRMLRNRLAAGRYRDTVTLVIGARA